jgi:hypothetical protein
MTNNSFYDSLKSTEKILYKHSYDFEIKYCNGNDESAHQAGFNKIQGIRQLKENMQKEQTYVDLSTGKTFKCTEAQLMAKHQF